jgi:rhodanese-related sulfurtransferase
MYLACDMIKRVTLACLICLLAAGLFTGLPAANFVAGAQGVNPVPPGWAGFAAQGNPLAAPQVHRMSLDDLNALMKSHADFLLVDARPREQYNVAHIPSAISMPLNEIPLYAGSLDKGRMIVTYCGNYNCPISTEAAERLVSLGYTNVYDYKGGIKEWQDTGYLTATGSG